MQYSHAICNTVVVDWDEHMISDQLKPGKPLLRKDLITPISFQGGWCKVFKCEIGGKVKALRLWHQEDPQTDTRERYQKISDYLSKPENKSKYLVDFKYIADGYNYEGDTYPVVLMDYCSGRPLKRFISDCVEDNDTDSILDLAKQFLEMTNELHEKRISHGDLQHDNIIVDGNGDIKLVDYDSMYVPGMEGYKDVIQGKPGYQHTKARDRLETLQPYTDYFSELMIFMTLYLVGNKPELWDPDLVEDDSDGDMKLLFNINEIKKDDTKYNDYNIKGLPSLLGSLRMALRASNLSALSPLKSYVEAANIYR